MAKITKTQEELAELRRLYEDEGMTIEQISLDIGHSAQLTRHLLLDAGTKMRKPGQRASQQTREDRNEQRMNRNKRYLDPTASISKGNVSRMFR